MSNFGTVEREVTFALGANREKMFTCMVEYSYDSGDYYIPADENCEISSDITDQEGNIVTDLVDRYETITGVDVNEIAYEEFKELN